MENPRKLTSGISKFYKKCFILDEDALRRIQGVLENAGKKLTDAPFVVFYITREDDRFYEVVDVESVLSDPNITGKKVTEISIELRTQDEKKRLERDWIARVYYLKERKIPELFGLLDDRHQVRVQIASQDRNWALLLADELEPQVIRTFKAKATPRWLLLVFLLPFVLLLLKLIQTLPSEIIQVVEIILLAISVLLFLFATSKETSLPPSLARLFGPESSFLWGEELQDFPSREQLRTNIMWVIIVGFIISVISSAIFYFL